MLNKRVRFNKQGSTLALYLGLLILLLFLPRIIQGPYYRHILVFTLMYVVLAQAWNLTGGYVGQIALGNAVFFALGAYTSTLLVMRANVTPWIGMWVGGVVAALVALALGSVVLKLKGHYFAMATLAIGEIMRLWFSNWKFVGGAQGFSVPLRGSSWYYMQWTSKIPYYYIILMMAVLVTYLVHRLDRSKYGSYAKAVNQDEIAARSRGISAFRLKQASFALTAFITALVGTFYAQYVLYISPQSVLIMSLSILVAIIPIVGGVGTVWGPVLGAVFVFPLTEFLRAQLGGQALGLNYIFFGLAVIFVVMVEPLGLVALINKIGQAIRGGRGGAHAGTEH